MSAKIEVTYIGSGSINDATGARRRCGDRFSIDVEDYTDHLGEVRLPAWLEPDPAKARAKIAELKARPLEAARASAGSPAKVRTSNDPRDLFDTRDTPWRT